MSSSKVAVPRGWLDAATDRPAQDEVGDKSKEVAPDYSLQQVTIVHSSKQENTVTPPVLS